ncbi:DUF484 family protein [Marinobacteraceae bacterium S3BR75-40.1]
MSTRATVELSEEQVVDYLQNHPEFFERHEELLQTLRLPHPSGNAISLVERQVHLFREQRDVLRREMQDLIAIARQNDRLFEKSKRLLIQLLEAKALNEIAAVIDDSMRHDFGLDAASLVLLNEDKPTANQGGLHYMTLAEAEDILGTVLQSDRAICGRFRDVQLQALFPQAEAVGSAAVIPLRFNNLLGVLAVGSADPDFFDSSMGSLFLSYISDTLSRMLPPLLQEEASVTELESVSS